jgi:uncharacterized protein (DUF1499 family)
LLVEHLDDAGDRVYACLSHAEQPVSVSAELAEQDVREQLAKLTGAGIGSVAVEQQRQALRVLLDSVTLGPGDDLEYTWSPGR